MLALLAATALVPVSYNLPGKDLSYDFKLGFDGFVPILGGVNAKIDITVGLEVKGADDTDGNQKAVSDVKSLKVVYNDATMPFNEDNVRQYFPNTSVFTPLGKVVKNDAKDIKLPFQLPGLDVKRFPDLTFLTIEFPAEGVEQGKSWTYSRSFGLSSVDYTVTPTLVTDERLECDVKTTQTYDTLEGASHEVVTDKADALEAVSTKVEGNGKAVFDRKMGVIKTVDATAVADSKVTKLADKSESKRSLKTTLHVGLR